MVKAIKKVDGADMATNNAAYYFSSKNNTISNGFRGTTTYRIEDECVCMCVYQRRSQKESRGGALLRVAYLVGCSSRAGCLRMGVKGSK